MSERIFAAIWLVVCLVLAYIGWGIQPEFSYEPVGPRAYPLLLLALMAICTIPLLLKKGEPVDWPPLPVLLRIGFMLLLLLVYALVFEMLGFMLATALLTVGLGRLFGGSWKQCLMCAVPMGVGFFYFFDRLLDVPLPLGLIFS